MAFEFVEDEESFGVAFVGELVARWLSDAAFFADLDTEQTLVEHTLSGRN